MTAAQNIATIERLYAAMDRHDGEAMAACYAPGATFTDPVFVGLTDGEPQDMWRMLVGRSRDMTVELVEHEADGEEWGTARWIARYTFGQTDRPVVNDVRSEFTVRPGRADRDAAGRVRLLALGPAGARARSACCSAGPRC